ncbi:MAG: glycosyltransferase family 4 protein [Candidatus Cloacimonetes bacterium]|nr:glycosyltransferase family 4 protein [Candidatus Cloacimonadota bacterium]
MNILFINNKRNWGGVLSLIDRLAVKLAEENHQTWIISNKNSDSTSKFSKELKIIPRTFGMDYNPLLILYFIRFVKRNRIDVVVSNIHKEVIAGGIASRICKIRNFRLIGNERDFNRHQWIHELLVDKSIFPYRRVKELSLELFPHLKEKKLAVVYIGTKIQQVSRQETIKAKQLFNIPDNALVIGVTGRLVKEKGVHILIRAFKEFVAEYQNVVLMITGSGVFQEELKSLVSSLELQSRVIFTGFIPNSNIPNINSIYDIAVMPSFYESFAITLLEYFSLGKAVISTDVGVAAELITDNVNGFLIKENNVESLVDKLKLLVTDQSLRERFGKNAQQKIKNNFSEETMVKEFLNVFSEN